MKRIRRVIHCMILVATLTGAAETGFAATAWNRLARVVGQSETAEERARAIADLRARQDLPAQLISALETPDRLLALDVIVALSLRELVPDLLGRVASDADGFLVLNLNALLSPDNKNQIFVKYKELLGPRYNPTMSPGALVAMLEPLGRVGVSLSRTTVTSLSRHDSPEVRSAVVYYARTLALRHGRSEHVDVLKKALAADEFQIRLRAVSAFAELFRSSERAPLSRAKLLRHCKSETHVKVRAQCLWLVDAKPTEPSLSRKLAEISSDSWPARSAKPTTKTPSCTSAYDALYSKSVVNVRVVFGYKDTRPGRFVGDRHERIAFVQRITAPCATDQACGFTRSRQNADLFVKSVQGPSGRTTRVQLWVAHSAAGSDDQENRLDPFQHWQSRYASDAFFGGLSKADIVLYNGHSRFGGGPDFEPPVLNADQSIQTQFYRDERPGFSRTMNRLGSLIHANVEGGDGLKVLGLFSCASSQHFSDRIRNVAGIGLLSSRHLMYHGDALESSLAALSGLLERRCKTDLQTRIRGGSPLRAMKVEGLFSRP